MMTLYNFFPDQTKNVKEFLKHSSPWI